MQEQDDRMMTNIGIATIIVNQNTILAHLEDSITPTILCDTLNLVSLAMPFNNND